MNPIIELVNVRKYFPLKRGFREIISNHKQSFIKAVDDISLKVEKGKVLVLAGESGSGKTTLAKIAMLFLKPDSGKIIFDGRDVTDYKGMELKKIRTDIQMIHQDPYSSLDPRMKISEIVREPLDIHLREKTRGEQMEMVFKALEQVRLVPSADISEKYPHMLSGGQRQRVALARSLVLKPKLIVADEPVSMLDVSVRAEILELVQNLKDKLKISYIYITHDLATVRNLGDSIAIMYAGKIVEEGDIDKVLLNPLHPYTQALIDAISEPDPNNLNIEREIRIKHGEFLAATHGCKFYNRCLHAMDQCRNNPTLDKQEKDHSVSCFIYQRHHQKI